MKLTLKQKENFTMDAQSKKEFIGLTDDEIAYIVNNTDTLFDLEDFARTIEQALKEKNHVQ